MKCLLAAAAAIAIIAAPAVSARPYHHRVVHRHSFALRHEQHQRYHYRSRYNHRTYGHRYVAESRSEINQSFDPFRAVGHALSTFGNIIGGRPRGCPHAYCGCGTSLYLFGRIIDPLNLAANWLRFPHVSFDDASPGDAAVAPSRHHVLALVRHVDGPWWEVHDSNSGRGLTRDHVRNLAGWFIVNPHEGRA